MPPKLTELENKVGAVASGLESPSDEHTAALQQMRDDMKAHEQAVAKQVRDEGDTIRGAMENVTAKLEKLESDANALDKNPDPAAVSENRRGAQGLSARVDEFGPDFKKAAGQRAPKKKTDALSNFKIRTFRSPLAPEPAQNIIRVTSRTCQLSSIN